MNSSFLAQLLFLVSVRGRNVLWEVFNTSETEQEEGGVLSRSSRKPRSHPLDRCLANKGRSVGEREATAAAYLRPAGVV